MEAIYHINSSAPWFYAESVLTNTKIYLGFGTVLAVLTVISNGIFLITLLRKESLQTPPNILLGALCISDLLVGLVLEPLWLADFFKRIEHQFSMSIFASKLLIMYVVIGLSFHFMALISLDRYFAICHPFLYVQHATKRKAIASCGLTLLFLVVVYTISIILVTMQQPIWLLISSLVISVFDWSVMIFCHWEIVKVIRRQKRQITTRNERGATQHACCRNSERERKQANAIFILVAVFLICYLPTVVKFVLSLNRVHFSNDSQRLVFNMWVDFLLFLNSLANPLLYCFRLRSIRGAMIETLSHMKSLVCRN